MNVGVVMAESIKWTHIMDALVKSASRGKAPVFIALSLGENLKLLVACGHIQTLLSLVQGFSNFSLEGPDEIPMKPQRGGT